MTIPRLPRPSLPILTALVGAALLLPRTVWALAVPTLNLQIPTVKFSEIGRDGQFVTIPWLAEYMVGFYQYALGFGGAVAAIMMMWGGFEWLSSAGDAGLVKKAKKRIEDAVVGLVILFSAFIILNTLNPALTSLKAIQIEVVKKDPLIAPFDAGDQASSVGVTSPGTPVKSSGDGCFENTFGHTDQEEREKAGVANIHFPFCKGGGTTITLNKLAAPAFEAAFAAWEAAPLDSPAGQFGAMLKTWSCSPAARCPNVAFGGAGIGGLDAKRKKIEEYNAMTLEQQIAWNKVNAPKRAALTAKETKVYRPVSYQHLYGNAIDIAPCQNTYVVGSRAKVTTIPQEVVDIFAKQNIYWAGFAWAVNGTDPNAEVKRDGMHFEWHGKCWN